MLNVAKDGCQMDGAIRQVELSEPKLCLAHNQDRPTEDGEFLDRHGNRKDNLYTQRTI